MSIKKNIKWQHEVQNWYVSYKSKRKKQELKRKKKHVSCHEYGIFDIVQADPMMPKV